MSAPTSINQVEFTFVLIKTIALTMKMIALCQSMIVDKPSLIVTAAISAIDAILTPSKTIESIGFFLSFSNQGNTKPTNKKEGKKIPTVAAIAPGSPAMT